jgi:hypothetical protein
VHIIHCCLSPALPRTSSPCSQVKFTKSAGIIQGPIHSGSISSTKKSVADKVADLVAVFGQVGMGCVGGGKRLGTRAESHYRQGREWLWSTSQGGKRGHDSLPCHV